MAITIFDDAVVVSKTMMFWLLALSLLSASPQLWLWIGMMSSVCMGLQVLHSCSSDMMDCKGDNVLVAMGPLGEDLHCTLVDLSSCTNLLT